MPLQELGSKIILQSRQLAPNRGMIEPEPLGGAQNLPARATARKMRIRFQSMQRL